MHEDWTWPSWETTDATPPKNTRQDSECVWTKIYQIGTNEQGSWLVSAEKHHRHGDGKSFNYWGQKFCHECGNRIKIQE